MYISAESSRLVRLIVDVEDSEENTSPLLRDYWIKLGDQLIIEGVEPAKVASTSADLILTERAKRENVPKEDLSMGGYFYRVQRQLGRVDTSTGRPAKEEFTPEGNKNSSKENIFEKENRDTIDLLYSLKDWTNETISLFSENHFESIVPKDELNEMKLIVSQAIQHANDNLNNKTMIPHAHFSILFREFIQATSGSVSLTYYTHVKKKAEFTAKQAGKIVRGFVKNMPLRYEPQDEDEAEACGYSGLQCKKCNYWRTEILFNDKSDRKQLHCYKCKDSYDAPRPDTVAVMINETSW